MFVDATLTGLSGGENDDIMGTVRYKIEQICV